MAGVLAYRYPPGRGPGSLEPTGTSGLREVGCLGSWEDQRLVTFL